MQTKRDVTTGLVNDLITTYEAKNAAHGNAYGDRIKKAGRLVLDGKVQKVDDNQYLVQSAGDPKIIYKVNGTCDCPDHAKAPAGWCKHRIAARFQHSVNLYFSKLEASGFQPHEHGYGCGNHNPPPIECWQVECPDGPLIACPICEKNQPSPLSTVDTTTACPGTGSRGEMTDTPFPEKGAPTMMSSIGSVIAKVFQGETPEPEPCGEKHPGMTCEEYESGEQRELTTDQYEPAPVLVPKVTPMPEAPVSFYIKFKVDNFELSYTMRAQTDDEVIARLPNVLANLERTLKIEVDHDESFLKRLLHAFFPKPSRYTGK